MLYWPKWKSEFRKSEHERQCVRSGMHTKKSPHLCRASAVQSQATELQELEARLQAAEHRRQEVRVDVERLETAS